MKPIIKWVGGKTKLLPELISRLPERFERYYEPFAGGAALFFHLSPKNAVLGDLNQDLIAMYQALADGIDNVINELEYHNLAHCEAYYYKTRTRWNIERSTSTDRAAMFIYLNKTCFNGLWRVNRAGAFNASFGRYTDPPICVPEALRAASTLLGQATLRYANYRITAGDADRGDFVYFDPPYDANFTSYTADGFGSEHQRELAETARMLVSRGCHVMLSNSDTSFIRSLYEDFQIDQVKCARSINSNATKRGQVDEVIIRSYV